MHKGSCLCGGVEYSLSVEPDDIELCHCSVCRKAHASPMTAGSTVPATAFTVTKGSALLKIFESSPGKQRYFCQECGTHLYAFRPAAPDLIRLRIATLDTSLSGEAKAHIHADSKAEWYPIDKPLPQQ